MAYIARKKHAVGAFIFATDTGRYLFLMRADERYCGTWALAGGMVDTGETIITALKRECQEEIGAVPDFTRLVPVDQFTSPDHHFAYHTFFGVVPHEFTPLLNSEHHGYAWVASKHWPRPLHPGLWSTVQLEEVQRKIKQLED